MKKIIPLVICCNLLFAESILSQNVGIGTSTPTRARLEVSGVAGAGATSAIFGGDGAGISLQRNWPTIGFNQYRDEATGFGRFIGTGYAAIQSLDPNNGLLAIDMLNYGINPNSLVTSSVRALAITSLGTVGIGNVLAHANLQFPNELNSRKIVMWETANNDHQYYGFGINGGTLRYNVDGPGSAHRFYSGASSGSSNLLMSIWGDKKVLISNSGGGGFLGVNLDAAPYTLSIKQAAGTGIYLQEAGSGTNWEFRAGYTAVTDYAVLYVRCNGADVGFFRPTGEYVGYSDRRLKTNIEEMPRTLPKIMRLQPKMYEMKYNNSRHEKNFGFIAQEVKEVFPELVIVNKSSDSAGIKDQHALNYTAFGVLAVKAIQEQQQQINELRNENLDLKRKFDALEKKINALKQ